MLWKSHTISLEPVLSFVNRNLEYMQSALVK
jgi:hypothetical protein